MRAFSLQRKVATAIGVVLAVLLAVAMLSYASMVRLAGSPDRVERSYEVLRALDRVTTRLTSAESGARGYVVTGDAVHLVRLGADTTAVVAGLETLSDLLADDPAQQPSLRAMERLVRGRFATFLTLVVARTSGGFEAAAGLVGTASARAAADSIRALAVRMESTEVAQLQRGVVEQRLNMEYLTGAIVAAGLIVLLLGVLILVAVQQDINARAAVATALVEAKEAAEAASRSKSDFLARMSHELRTPLNSVIGFSNVLLKNKAGRLDEQDLSYLSRIAANGRHLLALINDVLDLSRVEAGRMPVESVPVAVDALVADLVTEFEAQSRTSDVRLLAMMPPNMTELHTDAIRLRQVLVNLVANALKFTERGSVTIRVDVDRLTREPTRIAVVDTGIGIPADRQQRIFNAFEQASSGTTRRYGGTGLGLTIARSLCEVLGYRLEMSSHEGIGSVFSVVLSADAESRRAVFRRPSPPSGERPVPERLVGQVTDPARRLVLIVDDEADARLLLSQYVEDFGCQALAVGSVQQGLAAAREFRPDLIILDLLIPSVSGWDMLRDLQAEPGISDIPVLVVSVVGGGERGAPAGVAEALEKPVSREDLHAALRRTLGLALARVLVIDDDPTAQRDVAAHLRTERDLEVLSAASGREALLVLDTVRPDLIVLGLGGTAGAAADFVEALRRDRRYLHVPVVAMTARGSEAPDDGRLRAEVRAVLTREEVLQGGLERVLTELGRAPRVTIGADAP